MDKLTRRDFLRIAAGTLAVAPFGFCGCRKPEDKAIAMSEPAEDNIHGVPKYFATAFPRRHSAIPILVKTIENHPVKIEGNPLIYRGGTDRYTQALLFELYDPLRCGSYWIKTTNNHQQTDKDGIYHFIAKTVDEIAKNKGKGFCILTGASSSPSRYKLISKILDKLPYAGWYEYEAIDFDRGNAILSYFFGEDVVCRWKFDLANVILSLDCDFVDSEEDSFSYAYQFVAGRNPDDGEMNRLYCVEGGISLTGAVADHRLCVPPSMVHSIAAAIALEILREKKFLGEDFLKILQNHSEPARKWEKWIKQCALDLLKSSTQKNKKPLVLVGYGQPESVHALALAMNLALGGRDISFSVKSQKRPVKPGTLNQLAQRLNNNEVTNLVIIDCNPVYNAPVDLNWAQIQKKAGLVIHSGLYEDETAIEASVHIPKLHFLECWGDARMSDGTLLAIQPVTKPVFEGISELELLTRLSGENYRSDYDIVRETFADCVSADNNSWNLFLKRGFAEDTEWKNVSIQPDNQKILSTVASWKENRTANSYQIVFIRSPATDDGRYYTNIWLQEFPDPITRIVWDNAALISPQLAKTLGIYDGKSGSPDETRTEAECKKIEIQVGNRTLTCPAFIQPGIADNTIILPLGYGRKLNTIWGITDFSIGFNAYTLKLSNGTGFTNAVSVKVVNGETYKIARVQKHDFLMTSDDYHELTIREYQEVLTNSGVGKFIELTGKRDAVSGKQSSGENQWGMVIDLSKCIGCGACVTACRAENNIPVVGKEQVLRGREMDWIRVERYYCKNTDDYKIRFRPMMCMHCENAPCEYVCPFNATVHDSEGLNLMVYNRCAGARYCMNNCPYKVRRFNYLDYSKIMTNELYDNLVKSDKHGHELAARIQRYDKNAFISSLISLLRNPEVTVRMRGIAEKCSYCVQRIQEVKAKKKIEAGDYKPLPILDGEVKTACEQACPTGAIIFGNLNDPNSYVSKMVKSRRGYIVLPHLNTKPRTIYLARITNPNPEMAGQQQSSKPL